MPFCCPVCQCASLAVTHGISLPPDDRSDEIILQFVSCAGCGMEAIAVYEESRRGALDQEAWEHYGYCISQAEMDELKGLLAQCPKSQDAGCRCQSHVELQGWFEQNLGVFEPVKVFQMIWIA